MKDHIFRAYDIRGVVGVDFREDDVEKLGFALAVFLEERGCKEITVARDTRISSPRLQQALLKGLCRSSSLHIYNIGKAPTPVAFFSVDALGFDACIMVTASHNPPADNGFKIRVKDQLMSSDGILEIKSLMNQKLPDIQSTPTNIDIHKHYLELVLRDGQPPPGKWKIVVDGGNGVAGPWLCSLLEMMSNDHVSIEIIPLYCKPDGNFPAHPPDPTVPKNVADLKRVVLQEKADLGIGLDGDGDRLALILSNGDHVFGDRLLGIFAQDILTWRKGYIVQDIKCSKSISDVIAPLGGIALTSACGYVNVEKMMREHVALLGGEMSSHIFFADRWYGFDDGIYASSRAIQILPKLIKLHQNIPQYISTPELRIQVTEEQKVGLFEHIHSHPFFQNRRGCSFIDGIRYEDERGWFLIRPSNTEPKISVRIESTTEEYFGQLKNDCQNILQEYNIILP
jgi:phosphomannomutase / phosphoglucomutase